MPIRRLPPTIRQIPKVSDAWHHHHAERIEDHENRLQHLERGFHLSNLLNKQVKTPLGDLPIPLAIAGGATLIWWKPDLVLKLFG
jgi:hypothetical protein